MAHAAEESTCGVRVRVRVRVGVRVRIRARVGVRSGSVAAEEERAPMYTVTTPSCSSTTVDSSTRRPAHSSAA